MSACLAATSLLLVLPIALPQSASEAKTQKTFYCVKGTSVVSRTTPGKNCPKGYLRTNLSPPSQPRGLRVSIRGTTATLKWNTPLSFGGSPWLGYWASASYPGNNFAGYCVVNSLSCQIKNLIPGNHYRFVVKAYNGLGLIGVSGDSIPAFGTCPGSTSTSTIPNPLPQNSQMDTLRAWYANFSLTLSALASLINDYNATVGVYGEANAWSWNFVNRWNSIANQIGSDLAPNSFSIQQAQSTLSADMHMLACLGETFDGVSCPGVYQGWLGYGPSKLNQVQQDLSNLNYFITLAGI